MKKLWPWFAALALILVTFNTIYTAVQQAQRTAANQPQIQLATDTARSLNKGDFGEDLAAKPVELETSLAPFTIIYNKQGQVVNGSGYLAGKNPSVPRDMLKAADDSEYHTETWEPQDDLRFAAVIVETKNYYVLSARSLQEAEKAQSDTLRITLVGAMLALVLFGAVFVFSGLDDNEIDY